MAKSSTNGKTILTPAALSKAVKNICNILRRDKAKGARLYVPELTWMFFLRYLDQTGQIEEAKSEALGLAFESDLPAPYRWQDWAAPYNRNEPAETIIRQKKQGWKRCELDNQPLGAYLHFVNEELFQYLKSLKDNPLATHRQRIISEVFFAKERTVLASEFNLKEALDKVHDLTQATISEQHLFKISQAFEGLLPTLGEKANDGGQFFTPREVIRLIAEVVNPQLGGKVYDPCCGTGGFLIEAYHHLLRQNPSATQKTDLKTDTFFGREDAAEAIPILLANMVLHDIDLPRIWHGNTLTGEVTYGDLFAGAPPQFEYILTNPPFGSKESKTAQSQFAYKTNKAQILFLQHIMSSLADGGVCGMVIDDGVLFHTKTVAYKQTKRKLLNECNLFCIVRLPGGVFVNAGAGVKTDLLFFKKGEPTERIWYYDLTLNDEFRPRKVNKGNPLEYKHFADFLHRLRLPAEHPEKTSHRSWFVSHAEVEAKGYDLNAPNNNAPDFSDKRTTADLYRIIQDCQEEIKKGLKELMR